MRFNMAESGYTSGVHILTVPSPEVRVSHVTITILVWLTTSNHRHGECFSARPESGSVLELEEKILGRLETFYRMVPPESGIYQPDSGRRMTTSDAIRLQAPIVDVAEDRTPGSENTLSITSIDKRRRTADIGGGTSTPDVDVPLSACPSSAAWRALRTALDLNNTVVTVYQPGTSGTGDDDSTDDSRPLGGYVIADVGWTADAPRTAARGQPGQGQDRFPATARQWFYTVTCRNDAMTSRRDCPGCCVGIDRARYRSSCHQKRSYVKAYVSRHGNRAVRQYEWTWIQVDTSCACAVTPRVAPVAEL